MPRLHPSRPSIAGCLLSVLCVCSLQAAEPLHVRIDKMIDAAKLGPAARITSDEEFVRRIYLDLTGQIPTVVQAREFLNDKAADKRAKLVEKLLASSQYSRHMTDALHVMLMERRTKAADWLTFLRTSVEQNKPWNEIAAAVIRTDGSDAKNRGPVNYFTTRSVEPNLLTREIGRMFFGMDLQCAQCHNHPLIDDYLQDDYYGIYGFLSRTYLFQPDKKKPAMLADKPQGANKFKSVFTGIEGDTRPRLPGGEQVAEPVFKKGDEYKVKPDPKKKTLRPIPKYSRRERLAQLLAEGKNMAFRRNIVNRLWAQMMGRGLVHPPDVSHSGNPPSHPELLDMMANEFAAMKFDMKAFLRELALTKTYQRAVHLPDSVVKDAKSFGSRLAELAAEEKRLEVLLEATEKLSAKADEEADQARSGLSEVAAALKKVTPALAAASKIHAPKAKAEAAAKQQLAAKQAIASPLIEALASTRQSLKLQPADKLLLDVATKLEAKSKAVNAEVVALQAKATLAISAAKATGDKLAAVQKQATELNTRKAALDTKLATATKTYAALFPKVTKQTQDVNVIQRRIETVEAFVSYGKQLEIAVATRDAADKQLLPARPLLPKREAAANRLDYVVGQLADATKLLQDAGTRLTTTRTQITLKSSVAPQLADISAKTAAVLKLHPADAEIKKIAAAAKAKSDKTTAEVKSLQATEKQQVVAGAAAKDAMVKVTATRDAALKGLADLDKQLAPTMSQAKPALDKAQAADEALNKAYDELVKRWSQHFVVGVLEPLSPEQMAWSVMRATGLWDRQVASSASVINKKKPMKPADLKDPAKLAARSKEIEAAAQAKLQGNVATFVGLFSASAGQPQYDFFATAEQALFFANGSQVRSWVSPSGDNLAGRLIKVNDSGKLADELYMSVLTRRPTKDEVDDVTRYLAARPKEKSKVVQEMVWALLSSTEFRFHH